MRFSKNSMARVCDICGDHINSHNDHRECSKIKQQIHQDENRQRRAKRMSKKQADFVYYEMRDK